MTTRITCLTCGAALTPGGPACCPLPRTPVEAPGADQWRAQARAKERTNE